MVSMPWNLAAKKLEKRIDNQCHRLAEAVAKKVKDNHQKTMAKVHQWCQSEQIKFNRLDARIKVLEDILEEEVKQRDLDRAAAMEIEGET